MKTTPSGADALKTERASFAAWIRTHEDEHGAVDEASAWAGWTGRVALSAAQDAPAQAAPHLQSANCEQDASQAGFTWPPGPTLKDLTREMTADDIAMGAAAPAAQGEPAVSAGDALPTVHSTAPERIYLCIGDEAEQRDMLFDELDGITWSHDQPVDVTVPYVRADLASATAAQEAPVQAAQAVPQGLEDRIEAAIQRIVDNHAPRRIPADPTDVDLVLAEVLALIRGKWPPFWIHEAAPAAPQPAAPVHPGDDAVFELWWADHMPNASQADAWSEWCSLRANQPEPQSAAQQGELSADALDAARYRWLRTRWGRIADEYDGDSNQLVAIREAESHFEGWDIDPASLDRAIDAAIEGHEAERALA